LLTGAASFDEMLLNSEKGDNKRVDMLVGDIYGSGYNKIGLKATAIASSFGKVFKCKPLNPVMDSGTIQEGTSRTFSKEDVSRSLLYAVRYAIYGFTTKYNSDTLLATI
jgi:type II pantothenate kinase